MLKLVIDGKEMREPAEAASPKTKKAEPANKARKPANKARKVASK